jgi:hypothetical protein
MSLPQWDINISQTFVIVAPFLYKIKSKSKAIPLTGLGGL